MKLKTGLLYLALFATVLVSSCGGDDDSEGKLPPSNLQVSVNVNTDGSGKVDVTATADNALYYQIYFGDVNPETPVQSNDGTESHTYFSTGTYTITVNAHSSVKDFITATEEVTVNLTAPDDGYVSPETREGLTLVWRDEFSGSALNTAFWNYETGAGGWGNNELQFYRAENNAVANGYLTITAKKENFSGSAYTSSRLTTQGKKEFVYGRVDIRAKVPKGQGIWPALWMLGGNISTVGWPKCGEIDIMEMIGGSNREKTVHGTLHWANASDAHAQAGGSKTLSSGMYSDEFHVYSVSWDASKIKWYIDDVSFAEINIAPADLSEFHAEHFFIFNIAVGGNWPGSPDGTTVLPQEMKVDYIRVFQ
jgi:beta-glucanase (GH16 family)